MCRITKAEILDWEHNLLVLGAFFLLLISADKCICRTFKMTGIMQLRRKLY